MPFSAILIIYDLSPYSFLKYSLSFYLLFSFCLLVFLIFFLFLAVLFLKRYIVLFYLPNDSLAFTLFLFQVLSSFISSKCTQSYLFHFAIHLAFILISTTFWFPYLFFLSLYLRNTQEHYSIVILSFVQRFPVSNCRCMSSLLRARPS